MPSWYQPCVECGGRVEPFVGDVVCCVDCGLVQEGRDASLVAPEALVDSEPFQVPDLAEVVIGWRAWGVDERCIDEYGPDPLLRSVSHTTQFWTPREAAEAVCDRNRKPHPICEPKCSCGFYSARTYEHLMSMSYHVYDADANGFFHVIGEVSNWGRVREGDQGWRSQFSYPRRLYVPYEAWELGPELEDAYGIPVSLKDILNDGEAVR